MQRNGGTSKSVKPIGLTVLFLLVLAGTGCAGTLKGQVLDAQTGQPIEGAVLLGVWSRVVGIPGLHHTEFVAMREVETDAAGRFELETPGKIGVDEEAVTVYKPGYVAWSNLFIFPTLERRQDTGVPSRVLLERFLPDQSHRRHISFITDATAGVGLSSRAPRFWEAVRPEELMQ